MKRNLMQITGCFAMLLASSSALAEIKLNALFANHMVLQRGVPVPVWGKADAGEKVSVAFAGQTVSTTADANGKWTISLQPLQASEEGRELVASGSGKTVTLNDVVVGDVFLCGGQSNMRSPLFAAHNSAEVLPEATDTLLREFAVKFKTSPTPADDLTGSWNRSDPQVARNFTAVGYFFAQEIRKTQKVPVGLINAAWGGTPIQTWISLESYKIDPPIEKQLKEYADAIAQHEKVLADPSLTTKYEQDLKTWQKQVKEPFDAEVKQWEADKAAGKSVGEKPKLSTPEPTNPDPTGMPSPSRRPSTPTVAFNGMIAPSAPYAVKAILWYQGEADGSRGFEYRGLFPRLIRDWRKHWANPELPFLYVQIPAGGADKTPVANAGMAFLREAQAMALKEPKTSMAVILDIGDPNDAHPADKIDVGRRLALLARRDVYGEKLIASGPVFDSFKVEGSKVRVRFRDIGTGLKIDRAPWTAKNVEPLPTDKLIGFFVAGADKSWHEATAEIDGDSVVLTNAQVAAPVAVRYGWASSPRCNLYNNEGFPAAPFRTDDWDGPAKPK